MRRLTRRRPMACTITLLLFVLALTWSAAAKEVMTIDDLTEQQKRLLGLQDGRFSPRTLSVLIQIAQGKGIKEVHLPPGVHQLVESITIEDLDDMIIDGQGATLVFTRRSIGVRLINTSNVQLKNIQIDYEPLPFTQGSIVQIGDVGRWYDIKIDPGYPVDDELIGHFRSAGYDMFVVDEELRSIKPGTPDYLGSSDIEVVSHDTLRVRFGYPTNRFQAVQLGDLAVVKYRGAHAIQLSGARDTVLDNITILSSPHMGIVESAGAGGNRYTQVTITPGERPAGATRDRLLSTNYDGFHSIAMNHGPFIDGCFFERMGDDGVNVNSSMAVVIDVQGRDLLIAPRYQTAHVEVGDRLQLVDGTTYDVLGQVRVEAVEQVEDGRLTTQARGFWRSVLGPSDPGVMRLTLEDTPAGAGSETASTTPLDPAMGTSAASDLQIKRGTLVGFLDRAGQGATIKNCTVRGNRARALLVRAPGTVIQDNTFEDISLGGIIVVPELNWMEGPIPYAMTISGNTIENMGLSEAGNTAITPFWGAGIAVMIGDGSNRPKQSRSIQDVVIENNVIRNSGGYDIVIRNASGIVVRGNDMAPDGLDISESEDVTID